LPRNVIDAVRSQLQDKESNFKYGLNNQVGKMKVRTHENFGAYQYNEEDVAAAHKYFGGTGSPPTRQELLANPRLQEQYLEGYWMSRLKANGLRDDPEFQALRERAKNGDIAAQNRMAEILISQQTSTGRDALAGRPWAGDPYHGYRYWMNGFDQRLANARQGPQGWPDPQKAVPGVAPPGTPLTGQPPTDPRWMVPGEKLGGPEPPAQVPRTGAWSDLPTYAGARNFSPQTVDPKLREILSASRDQFEQLHPGYTIQGVSGRRAVGAGAGPHWSKTGAIDMIIVGPDGKAIPHTGSDPTGLYKEYARISKGEQMARYPELNDRFAWGGAFGTQKGGGGPPDLMHFDLSGERGHWTQNQMSKMGPLPGLNYGQKVTLPEPSPRPDNWGQGAKSVPYLRPEEEEFVPTQPTHPIENIKVQSRDYDTNWEKKPGSDVRHVPEYRKPPAVEKPEHEKPKPTEDPEKPRAKEEAPKPEPEPVEENTGSPF
jgi:hypothetical protein